jgi:hypothetical protein
MSRAVVVPVALYVAITLVSPVVRGTVKGPLVDHAVIVLAAAALALLSCAAQRARSRRSSVTSASSSRSESLSTKRGIWFFLPKR